MNEPLITTIIPTYRRPHLLRRAVKSALKQTYPYLQVCVYDDASNDGTADIVADLMKQDSRVFYHCHSKNLGSVSNYNYAFKNIHTPFFSLLSDDDILLPEFYETAIKGLLEYPEAAFYATRVIHMEPDGVIVAGSNWTWGDGYYLPPEGILAMVKNNRHPPTWTGTLFRTMVIEHIGLLDEEVGGTYDNDYLQRIALSFAYLKSKTLGAIYLMNPSSMSVYTDYSLTWPGSLKMIRNVMDDNRIPLVVREQFHCCAMKELKLRMLCYGKKYLISKRYDNAYQVAEILYRHLDLKLWALTIRIIAKGCQYFSNLHNILLNLIELSHRLCYKKRGVTFPGVEKYIRYLNEI